MEKCIAYKRIIIDASPILLDNIFAENVPIKSVIYVHFSFSYH